MNKNQNGFTLIEVIISLAIISLALVSFVSLFGQSLLLTDRGSEITEETFDHQEFMENEIVNIKKGFVDGSIIADDSITIFTGDYQSDVDVKIITEDIKGNRKFQTLVSNVEVLTPAIPDVSLDVRIYEDDTFTTEAFPWHDDDIIVRAQYTLHDDPVIYNRRLRWYESKENIVNPSFPSEYDVIYEDEEDEPFPEVLETSLLQTDVTEDYFSVPNRFYNFEVRAYTLAGRLGYFMNEDRILVLPREGTEQWQDFMEDIYFSNIVPFNNLSQAAFAEVMQNPIKPTLNTDWLGNADSEGAQVAMEVPTDNFRTDVKFEVDSQALTKNLDNLGFGFLLGNNNNTGLILNFDVTNSLMNVREVNNGSYDGDIISSINLLTNSAFENFRSTIDGVEVFNWDQEYNLTLSYLYDDLILRLEYFDEDDNLVQSGNIIFENLATGYDYDYFGFKSFSSLDYNPQERNEISNKYDRNYAAHFYDIDIPENINENSDDDSAWTRGESQKVVQTNPSYEGVAYDDNLVIKAYRFYSGNGQDLSYNGSNVSFFAQIFFFEQEGTFTIQNNSILNLNANQLIFVPSILLVNDESSNVILNVINNETLIADAGKEISVPLEFREILVDGSEIGGIDGTLYGEVYFMEDIYEDGDEASDIIIQSGYYRFPDGFNFQEDWDKAAADGGLIPQSGGLIPVY